jgi:hypothetical protein
MSPSCQLLFGFVYSSLFPLQKVETVGQLFPLEHLTVCTQTYHLTKYQTASSVDTAQLNNTHTDKSQHKYHSDNVLICMYELQDSGSDCNQLKSNSREYEEIELEYHSVQNTSSSRLLSKNIKIII